MKTFTAVKRLAAGVGILAAVAVVGMPSKAQALGFPSGDLAFIIYGGNNEYYQNLGSINTILSNPTTQVTLTSQNLADVTSGASLGIKFTLLGSSSDVSTFFTGSQPSTPNATQIANSFPAVAQSNFGGWANLLGAATGGNAANNPLTLAASHINSFTNGLSTDGRLNGSMGFSVATGTNSTLSLFSIFIDPFTGGETYTKVATAVLTSGGGLTITSLQAVPVPAAVVLFGTGLAGLIGIARRSRMGQVA